MDKIIEQKARRVLSYVGRTASDLELFSVSEAEAIAALADNEQFPHPELMTEFGELWAAHVKALEEAKATDELTEGNGPTVVDSPIPSVTAATSQELVKKARRKPLGKSSGEA